MLTVYCGNRADHFIGKAVLLIVGCVVFFFALAAETAQAQGAQQPRQRELATLSRIQHDCRPARKSTVGRAAIPVISASSKRDTRRFIYACVRATTKSFSLSLTINVSVGIRRTHRQPLSRQHFRRCAVCARATTFVCDYRTVIAWQSSNN